MELPVFGQAIFSCGGMGGIMLGSIEAGGTKFICAVGNDHLDIMDELRLPTEGPEQTITACLDFFRKYPGLKSLAIGSFGPIELNPRAEKYGFILDTPKKGWANRDILGMIRQGLDVPLFWTTDVNSAAYGEWQAHGQGADRLVYVTVGTGIGGGVVDGGQIMAGRGHYELGHMLIKRHAHDEFGGCCAFHHDCLEGLASGPAIAARMGQRAEMLAFDDPQWRMISYYLAQAAVNITLTYRPDFIVFGGGVLSHPALLDFIREDFVRLLNHYVPVPPVSSYIVAPLLGKRSATIGNFALAQRLHP